MNPPPLVELERVDVDLAGTPVLHDVTWRLRRGERWGVVGANGSGKTTFLGLVAGTIWPAPGHGERRYDFGRGTLLDAVQARREIVVASHELQDRYARWGWNFSAVDVVLSGVYRTDVPRRRPEAPERRAALAKMRELGIEHLAERRFLELSRGEQRRVLIARGIAFDPTVLLLDEPASGLDREARLELAALLERVSASIALVCTAHVEEDLPSSIDRVLRLDRGRIVAHENARAGLESTPTSANLTPTEAPRDTETAPAPLAHLPLVELVAANVWLGARHVLRDVDWRIDERQQWLVTGPNGSGKSTLLRLLHGQVRPATGGSLRWPAFGDPRNVWTLRRRVAWVSPELQAAYRYPTSVRACIASGFDSSIGLTRSPSHGESSRVAELLTEFVLEDLAERALSSLSYGQARRALIARALVNRPRLLLLDEPWEGLDDVVSATLNAALRAAIAHGTQIVCATHLAAHRELFTHAIELEAGRIVGAERLETGGP